MAERRLGNHWSVAISSEPRAGSQADSGKGTHRSRHGVYLQQDEALIKARKSRREKTTAGADSDFSTHRNHSLCARAVTRRSSRRCESEFRGGHKRGKSPRTNYERLPSCSSLLWFIDHDSAHQSIRNSAQGLIGAINSALEAIQIHANSTPAPSPDGKAAPCVCSPSEVTRDTGNTPEGIHDRQTPNAFPESPGEAASPRPRCDAEEEAALSLCTSVPAAPAEATQPSCRGGNDDVVSDGPGSPLSTKDRINLSSSPSPFADATIETVYSLLAAVHPSRDGPVGSQSRSATGLPNSLELGWKIQVGTQDVVDAANRTISIKNKEGETPTDVLIVPESPNVWCTNVGETPAHKLGIEPLPPENRFKCGGFQDGNVSCPSKMATNGLPSRRPATEERDLSLDYYRQFPTLGDLLSEPDKSRHADIFRDILINHGKCCAEMQAAVSGGFPCQKPKGDSETEDESRLPPVRYYKVERSRPEVYEIVSR